MAAKTAFWGRGKRERGLRRAQGRLGRVFGGPGPAFPGFYTRGRRVGSITNRHPTAGMMHCRHRVYYRYTRERIGTKALGQEQWERSGTNLIWADPAIVAFDEEAGERWSNTVNSQPISGLTTGRGCWKLEWRSCGEVVVEKKVDVIEYVYGFWYRDAEQPTVDFPGLVWFSTCRPVSSNSAWAIASSSITLVSGPLSCMQAADISERWSQRGALRDEIPEKEEHGCVQRDKTTLMRRFSTV